MKLFGILTTSTWPSPLKSAVAIPKEGDSRTTVEPTLNPADEQPSTAYVVEAKATVKTKVQIREIKSCLVKDLKDLVHL